MKKVPRKKIIKNNNDGVLLEDLNSKLTFLVEGHSVLTKQIRDIDKKLTDFQEETNHRFDEIDSRFGTVFKYLSKNESQGEEISGLKKRVVVIEKKLAISK